MKEGPITNDFLYFCVLIGYSFFSFYKYYRNLTIRPRCFFIDPIIYSDQPIEEKISILLKILKKNPVGTFESKKILTDWCHFHKNLEDLYVEQAGFYVNEDILKILDLLINFIVVDGVFMPPIPAISFSLISSILLCNKY